MALTSLRLKIFNALVTVTVVTAGVIGFWYWQCLTAATLLMCVVNLCIAVFALAQIRWTIQFMPGVKVNQKEFIALSIFFVVLTLLMSIKAIAQARYQSYRADPDETSQEQLLAI